MAKGIARSQIDNSTCLPCVGDTGSEQSIGTRSSEFELREGDELDDDVADGFAINEVKLLIFIVGLVFGSPTLVVVESAAIEKKRIMYYI